MSALQIHLAQLAVQKATWEAWLADIPMTWIRA